MALDLIIEPPVTYANRLDARRRGVERLGDGESTPRLWDMNARTRSVSTIAAAPSGPGPQAGRRLAA